MSEHPNLLKSVLIFTNPKGQHNSSLAYQKMDEVQHQTSIYVAAEDIPAGVAITDARWAKKLDNSTAYQAEQERQTAEGEREQAETDRETAEGLREQGEIDRGNAYSQAELARDGLYATAESARDDLFTGSQQDRTSAYNLRENQRDDAYDAAELARGGLYESAESARGGLYESAEMGREQAFEAAEIERNQTLEEGIEAGRLNHKGPYNPSTLYSFNNWVTDSGSSYAYINPTPSTGVPLTDTTHWQQIASIGGQDLVDAAVAARDAAQGYKDAAANSAAQLQAGIGSPAKSYANLAAVNAANPAHDRTYLTEDDWKIALWDETAGAFMAGGVYQATAIADGSISPEKTTFLTHGHAKNLFNPDDPDIMVGKYLNTSGVASDNASRNVTGYMPVNPGDIIVGTSGAASSDTFFVSVTAYDANKAVQAAKGVINKSEYTVPAGVAYIRITTGTMLNAIIEATQDGKRSGYIPYIGEIETLNDKVRLSNEQLTVPKMHVYLPQKVTGIKNKPTEFFNDQVCLEADRYRMSWTGAFGGDTTTRPNRAIYRLDTVKTGYLTARVYMGETVIGSARTTVIVVNPLSNPVKLLSFGDSLTNHCVWQAELINLSGGLITPVGRRSRTVKDAGDIDRTVYNEGRAGWKASDYLGANNYGAGASDSGGLETPHPFWDATNSVFSWAYYMANNFPEGQDAPTAITVFLGMNDLGSLSPQVAADNLAVILASIRAYSATIPVIVITPHLTAMQTTSHDKRVKFLEYAKIVGGMISADANMHHIPMHVFMDSTNNFPMTDAPVNARSTVTVKEPTDSAHPNNAGYWQIADMVFGTLSKIFG